jgi:ABC-type uncharacterized transport system auxiliary subunit
MTVMKMCEKFIHMIVLILLFTGCFQRKPPVPVHYYSLQDRKPAGEASGKKTSVSLGILPFQAASSIENRILYRLSPVEIGYYEYEKWAEPPEEMTSRVFSEVLGSSGLFSNVTFGRDYPPSSVTWILTGIVERFEEDRSVSPPVARLSVGIEVFRTDGNRLLWNQRLSSSEPLEADTRSDLALAMDKNLNRILEDLLVALSRIPSLKKD